MPELLHKTEVRIEWTDIHSRVIHKRPKAKRSTGVHVSGVIKYVLTTAGLLTPDDVTDEFPLRMAIGMAWEDWVVGLWPGMKWQPGEKHLNEIYGSPDGITISKESPGLHQLEEFKATWKSEYTRPDILKEKIWMWQLAAYCKILRVRRARLHVLWINGSYRPPSPKYMVYELEFTQQELDQFWVNVMLKNKDFATAEKH